MSQGSHSQPWTTQCLTHRTVGALNSDVRTSCLLSRDMETSKTVQVTRWCSQTANQNLWFYLRRLTRFKKIPIQNYKFQMASGQGSLSRDKKFFFYSPPLSDISQLMFLTYSLLLALTQSFDSLFHSFITFCENEYSCPTYTVS